MAVLPCDSQLQRLSPQTLLNGSSPGGLTHLNGADLDPVTNVCIHLPSPPQSRENWTLERTPVAVGMEGANLSSLI